MNYCKLKAILNVKKRKTFMKKVIFSTILAASVASMAADALGGNGLFTNKGYGFISTSAWDLNITTNTYYPKPAAIGALEFETDDNDYYVLKFWSNGVANEVWDIQALHDIELQKGYSYQIKAQGYYFYNEDTGKTSKGASVGIQSPDGEDQYISEELVFDTEGFYSSTVYKHCSTNNPTARLYINGGITGDFYDYYYETYTQAAGFSIMNIEVIKTPITCSGTTTSSSSKTTIASSSSQTQLNGNRIGPVAQYGQLQAGTNASGQGRIYGSCPTWSVSGKEVQVKGMSLFWSINPESAKFWNADVVTRMVQDYNIQLIRAAMGVDENWGDGNYFTKTSYYQGLMDKVVQAAIDNDIYVIIDYHSHRAHENVADAKAFFSRMASKWGSYDNVIFEIFNEPACITGGSGDCSDAAFGGGFVSWSTIRTYANQVISTIRQYSDNLVIVGTPMWDQQPNAAIGSKVTDTANNTAYAFHYYAGTHSTTTEGNNAVKAMNAGLSVFVSEWGTINADGKGAVARANTGWQSWMNTYKLSSANWSLTSLVEDEDREYGGDGQGGSFFAANVKPSSSTWTLSTSGSWLKTNVFSSLPTSYTACNGGTVTPKSSASTGTKSSASTGTRSSSSQKTVVEIVESPWTSDITEIIEIGNNSIVLGDVDEDVAQKRTISREISVEKGEDYTVSARVKAENEDAITIKVLNNDSKKLCVDAFDIDNKEKVISCDFTATSSKVTVVLTVTSAEGAVTISNFTVGDMTAIKTLPRVAAFDIAVYGKTLQVHSAEGERFKVQVFDIMGNAVYNASQVSSGSASISLDALPNGNYIVRVSGKHGTTSLKASLK